MYEKKLENQSKLHITVKAMRSLVDHKLLIGLYFLLFILGIKISNSYSFYNESRVAEVFLLLGLGWCSWFKGRYTTTKKELFFFSVILVGSFFWKNPLFIVIDLLIAYLLYKTFCLLDYCHLLTKMIILTSFLIFLLLPVAIWDYIDSGIYSSNWYTSRLNIRIYNSYCLIVSIFAVWFYLTEKQYKAIYIFFLFLAFLSILLDGGRSAALAYSVFIAIVCIFNKVNRWKFVSVYSMSWLTYLSITYLASLRVESSSALGLQIARVTTSQRYDIWLNAFQCWSQHPILGCGFYQLDNYQMLAAHPHNLFIQSLTETGLVGFGFLAILILAILKNINWNVKEGYFVIAALFAIAIDMSLSGVHIYPVTQVALLWLFVFLLKNPIFPHAQRFIQVPVIDSVSGKFLPIAIYLSLTVFFLYICISMTDIVDNELFTRPRFWENGYRLF